MTSKRNSSQNEKTGMKAADKVSPKSGTQMVENKPSESRKNSIGIASSDAQSHPEVADHQTDEQQKKLKRPPVAAKKRDSDDGFEPLDPELQAYVGGFDGDGGTHGWAALPQDESKDEVEEKSDEEEGEEDEEEEEEEEEETEESLSEEEVLEPPFTWHPSEEGFKQSDLASRKKRRYVIGTHSFLELADPGLEKALDPGTGGDDENLSKAEKTRRGLKAEKDMYKELCKQLGVTPNSIFLQSLGSSVLDLTRHGLTEKEVVAICKTLDNDTHIKICRLGGNAAGYDGGMAIAGMIENNYTMIELNLSNTEILEAMQAICSAVGVNISLTSLDLSKNELGDQEMEYVGMFLEENSSIEQLFLSFNEIKDNGINEIGIGLDLNSSLILLDVSNNLIKGERNAAGFFTICSEHAELRHLDLRRNIIRNDGAKGIARLLSGNNRIEYLDLSCNIMEEPSGAPLGKSLNAGPRELEMFYLNHQWWHQEAAAAVLKPIGSASNPMPIKMIDFGYMLDVHKEFLKAKERALSVHPDLKIIHGEPYGLKKAKGPNTESLVIQRAHIVCENFETPLVMLMEELAKEPKKLSSKDFKKFIKSCNLYKDKSLTDAFEKVFPSGSFDVDTVAIIEAFDKEFPGLRKIPDPEPEGDPKEEVPKKTKKGKGKGGKGKKGKSGSKGPKKTKTKKK